MFNHSNKFIKILTISFIIFIAILLGFYLKIQKILNKETIYNNIYINNINVSNLTPREALLCLEEKLFYNKLIVLNYSDKRYTFTPHDFNIQYSLEEAVDQAYQYGRNGTKISNLKKIHELKNSPHHIQADRTFDEEMVKERLLQIEKDLYIEPKNATVIKQNENFNVISEVNGQKINFDDIYSRLLELLKYNDEGEVSFNLEVVKASYKSQDFKKFGDILGSFKTTFTRTNSNKGRITNLEIASSRINGTVLYPEEIFSSHSKFGKATKENGYSLAPTIVNGNIVDDYGGGICQVSSTLYNAVLLAELDVIQRKNHSLKLSYLDYGFDAAIAGDYIDFKFKNSSKTPIYIESYVTESEIICNIYGIESRSPNRIIKFENTLVQTVEPDLPEITYTSSLSKGVRKVKVNELKGYKYKVYKLVYENDILTEKVLINDSYYKPRSAQILVGTKE